MDLARVGASRRRDAAHSEQPAVWAARRRSAQVIYVVERNGMYPTWNKAAWRVMSRVDFAQYVDREVLCR
jgi:hypothetical protein